MTTIKVTYEIEVDRPELEDYYAADPMALPNAWLKLAEDVGKVDFSSVGQIKGGSVVFPSEPAGVLNAIAHNQRRQHEANQTQH